MSKTVLDASALLAYLHNEPGSDAVKEAITATAIVSSVNWSEVLSKVADLGKDLDEFALACRALIGSGITIVAFDHEDALLAAKLRTQTKKLGLSLGDRACLALGRKLQLPVMTADRLWKQLKIGLKILVIR